MLDWLKNIFNYLFKNNKALLQVAVDEIAREFFTKNPRYKPIFDKAIDQVIAASNNTMPTDTVLKMLNDKLQFGNMPAPEQQAIMTLFLGPVVDQMNSYMKKANIVTQTDEFNSLMQVLQWIQQMARV